MQAHEPPLTWVAIGGNIELATWLCDQPGVNPLHVSTKGYSAFSAACQFGNLDMAKWLLTTYPDLDPELKDVVCDIICNGTLGSDSLRSG